MAFSGYFQHVVKSVDINMPGKLRILFSGSGKNGRQVKNCVNFIFFNKRGHGVDIRAVDALKRP